MASPASMLGCCFVGGSFASCSFPPLQVVNESYEELVFSEPTELLHNKVVPVSSKPAPDTPLLPHLPRHSDAPEFAKISAAREKVASLVASIKQDHGGAADAMHAGAAAIGAHPQVKVEL